MCITFILLFFNSLAEFTKLKHIAVEKTTQNTKYLANKIFTDALKHQTDILNNDFKFIIDSMKLIDLEIKEFASIKSLAPPILKFQYNSNKNSFEYFDKKSIRKVGNKEFELAAIYKSPSGKRIPDYEKILSKLVIIEPLLITVSKKFAEAFTGIMITDKTSNYAIAYTSDPKNFSPSFNYLLTTLASSKILTKTEPIFSFKCIYSGKNDSDSHILISMPIDCKDGTKLRMFFSINYNKIMSRIYNIFEGKSYKQFNDIRFVINETGEIIYLPKEYYKLFSIPPDTTDDIPGKPEFANTALNSSSNPELKHLAEKLNSNQSGRQNINLNGKEYFLTFDKMPINNWTVALLVSKKDLYELVLNTEKTINDIYTDIYTKYIKNFLIIFIVGVVISLLIFNKIIIKPIEVLRRSVKKLGRGNFDIKLKEKGIREICDLSISFNKLGSQLKEYTENIEKQKALETELKIASELQNSVLPKVTDEFKREEFELYTKLIPATTMSGDFYDFFFVKKNTLALILADVSGKGLTAAFFMSMAKAIIKESCLTSETLDPGKILGYVNNILCKDNESSMFLTMYLVFYEIDTGKITYANAGHHEFILVCSSDNVSSIGVQNNPSIGIAENVKYTSEELQLNQGNSLALYTDGIIEAPDKDNIEYGTEKLIDIFKIRQNEKLSKIGDPIIKDVLKYQNGNKFDDITLLILRRVK
ncbi:MAG TPA: SpoIIE family protein phosphatase [Victivallales bacterium]|nr:SpoIIE family protein phosphatase [Victivallales bacterium]